jgi:NitT/TauT family transport system ATP-binding protein
VLVMSPRPGRVDLDLRIEIARPRSWKNRVEPRFLECMTAIREVFEARGILTQG